MNKITGTLDEIVYKDVTRSDILTALIILLLGFFIAKIISTYIRRSLKDNLKPSHLRVILKVVYYGVILIAIISVLPIIGIHSSGFLVAGGILGLVLAFASQSIISNFISGIFLFMERPVKIGDTVKIDDKNGVVEDVKILSTMIRGFDGVTYRIPNEKVFTNSLTNFSTAKARRLQYTIRIRYSDNATKAIEKIKELSAKHPLILKNPPIQAFVDELGDNSVDIIVKMWLPSSEWYNVKMEFLDKIKNALEKEGIEIPFPQRTVWLKNDLKT